MREADLSAELELKLREYCDRALGAGELSGEVREELYGHFRDRVLGYLNREDELSEADALLLARQHFGDAAGVRAMLLNEHAPDAVPELYRRMAAGVAVFVLVQPLAGLALMPLLNADSISPIDLGWAYTLWSILCTPLSYLPLRLWRTQMNRGEKPWFLCWPPFVLAALLLTLYAGVGALQVYLSDSSATLSRYDAAAAMLFWMNLVVQGMVWFWWCRIPTRAPRLFIHAVLGLGFYGWPLYAILVLSQDTQNTDVLAHLYAATGSLALLPLYFVQAGFLGLIFLGIRHVVPARGKG